MCTLTWISDPRGTRIYFNRDEQRTRLPASPPAPLVRNGVHVLAPLDGNAGGTWLSVNERGLAIAILNFYEADTARPAGPTHHRSRGQLVLDLSDAETPAAMRDRLGMFPVTDFRPFILVGIDAAGQGLEMRWDGHATATRDLASIPLPITTSSFRTAEVLSARRQRFDAMMEDGPVTDAMLRAFHRSRDPLGGPFSVTMTRPDAMTVSFCAVEIGTREIRFYYEPRAKIGVDPDYEAGITAVMNRT
jgi:hypothetical protein